MASADDRNRNAGSRRSQRRRLPLSGAQGRMRGPDGTLRDPRSAERGVLRTPLRSGPTTFGLAS